MQGSGRGRVKHIVTEGQRFGFWTVIDFPPLYIGSPRALCRCICGKEKEVQIQQLLQGESKSCGCARGVSTEEEYHAKIAKKVHTTRMHGQSGTRLYKIWLEIRRLDKNKRKRIVLCPEWQSFPVFKAWADANGYTDDHVLIRIEMKQGHRPGNCFWEAIE